MVATMPFWKVRMRKFLCSIDEVVWDVVEIGWTKPKAAKSTWDKAALAASNANSKALNAIFYGVSSDEFHRISHITVTRKHGRFWRPLMRVQRKLRTQGYKC